MKRIFAVLLLVCPGMAIPQTSLWDAVQQAQAIAETPICIPHREYWTAASTIFSLLMEIGQSNKRIKELERQLAERK